MLERRKAPRRPVFVGARIWFDRRFRLKCLVHNWSHRGAKLVLERPADLPDTFTLCVPLKARHAGCLATTKWRTRSAIGVELSPLADYAGDAGAADEPVLLFGEVRGASL